MKRFLALALLASALLYGQTSPATLTLTAPPVVKPGQPFTVTLTLANSQSSAVALEWTIGVPAGATLSPPTPGAATSAIQETLFCTPTTDVTCIALNTNAATPAVLATDPYSDGVVATFQMTLPASTPVGNISIPLANLFAVKSDLTAVSITSGTALTLKVTSFCDVNTDGVVDSKDESAVLTPLIISSAVCPLSACNLPVLEAVVRAASGVVCALTGQ